MITSCKNLEIQGTSEEHKTGMNQFSNEVDELPLPSITICSQNVFKNIDKDLTQGFMKLMLKKS